MSNEEKTININITGKKILAVLILAALWGGSLWLACRVATKKNIERHNAEESSQYPLLNPRLRNLEKEERLKKVFPTLIPLRDKLFEFLGGRKDNVAFYVEDLNGGAWVGWQEKEEFIPASLLKVPIAIGAMRKVDEGIWSLEKEFTLEEKYKDSSFGDLWRKETGTKLTLRELLEAMLKKSDNTSLLVLLNNLTPEDRDEVYYHIGLSNPENGDDGNESKFFFRNVSARNLATIFRALYNSTYLNRESSSYILEALSDTSFDETLLGVMPPDVIAAHKIAAFNDPRRSAVKNYHDCGIIFVPDRPYLYCLMTEEFNADEAQEIIGGMDKIIYGYFAKR